MNNDDGEILETYEDENGEYVFLENPKTGELEKHYIRDLIIQTFGNADTYDKIRNDNESNN